MSTTLLISIISTAVVYAATVLYAAVGEIFSQRAGIMNLGLEGIMLMGAVSGYMVAVYQQNLVLAMFVVVLVGAALGLVFSFLTVTMQADQTVSGMAMLTFGTGLSGFLGKGVSGVNANLAFEPIAIPVLSRIPILGPSLFDQNILVYLMYIIIPLSMIYLYKTRAGMILRALGENPAALDSAGYNVFALRYAYVTFGSIMTAVSGAVVSLGRILCLESPDSNIRSFALRCDQYHRNRCADGVSSGSVPGVFRPALCGDDHSSDLYYRQFPRAPVSCSCSADDPI